MKNVNIIWIKNTQLWNKQHLGGGIKGKLCSMSVKNASLPEYIMKF